MRLVPIGNSKGIRIPKAILEQCHIDDQDEIELSVKRGIIVIRPLKSRPRKGWKEAFLKTKIKHPDADRLLIEGLADLHTLDWEW